MKHSDVQGLLYDYLAGELSSKENQEVERHLASCAPCSAVLREFQQTLALLPAEVPTPAEQQSPEFWKHLGNVVEQRINEKMMPRANVSLRILETIHAYITLRPAYTYALFAAFTVLAIATAIVYRHGDMPAETAIRQSASYDSSLVFANNETEQRVSDYFRKSRTLLVGIANLKPDEEQGIDLTAEQKLSRNLLHEARYLRQQPIDGHAAKLIDDLEKILIELSHLQGSDGTPNVQLIRSGIHRENLLFKIRMAEATYDTSKQTDSKRIY